MCGQECREVGEAAVGGSRAWSRESRVKSREWRRSTRGSCGFPEVLEKKAVEQGDIRFFDLAALSAEPVIEGKTVRVKLTDFVIPTDEVPEEVQKAITHWSQWIDYWAVDWDNK